MSHVTAGGATTERTRTKTTVYTGDNMLNAFIAVCQFPHLELITPSSDAGFDASPSRSELSAAHRLLESHLLRQEPTLLICALASSLMQAWPGNEDTARAP